MLVTSLDVCGTLHQTRREELVGLQSPQYKGTKDMMLYAALWSTNWRSAHRGPGTEWPLWPLWRDHGA